MPWLGPLSPQSSYLPPVPSVQTAQSAPWTVEAALARALESNPDVQVALANVQRQDGLRLQGAATLLPKVGITASLDRRDEGLIDRTARELQNAGNPLTPLTPIATRGYDARIEVRQSLFSGLNNWSQVRRLAILHKKASLDARDLYLRVASQVRQAFEAALVRQTLVKVRRDAVQDLEQLATVAQKRFGAGELSEFDSLRAQTALKSAEADLAQAESDLARAHEMFCRMLYIEVPDGGVRLDGTVLALDYAETFESALNRARAGRLDVRAAELQLEAAKLSQRGAMAPFLPRLEAFGSYGYRSSYYDYGRQLEGWTVGVVGRWDIFDSGQTVGSVRVQKADRRVAEIRLAEAQRQVGSQIRELFSTLDQSRTVMAAQASARDLGERSVREARKLFEVGRVPLESVLNAEIAYRQAFAGWLGSVYNHNSAVYQLDYATANEAFLDAAARVRP
jgi:outer membrane protein TolC